MHRPSLLRPLPLLPLPTMRVTVFGSSSPRTPVKYLDIAYELGGLLAERKHICVNGGGREGCMGAMNKGARAQGGEIIGVLHERWKIESEDLQVTKMIYTSGNDLTDRKQILLDNGDGVLVLPGGVGTLDELWDSVCGKSLQMKGMVNKPICVVNVDGYFNGSILQLQRAAEENLLYSSNLDDYFHVEDTPKSALLWLEQAVQDKLVTPVTVFSNSDQRMQPRDGYEI